MNSPQTARAASAWMSSNLPRKTWRATSRRNTPASADAAIDHASRPTPSRRDGESATAPAASPNASTSSSQRSTRTPCAARTTSSAPRSSALVGRAEADVEAARHALRDSGAATERAPASTSPTSLSTNTTESGRPRSRHGATAAPSPEGPRNGGEPTALAIVDSISGLNATASGFAVMIARAASIADQLAYRLGGEARLRAVGEAVRRQERAVGIEDEHREHQHERCADRQAERDPVAPTLAHPRSVRAVIHLGRCASSSPRASTTSR